MHCKQRMPRAVIAAVNAITPSPFYKCKAVHTRLLAPSPRLDEFSRRRGQVVSLCCSSGVLLLALRLGIQLLTRGAVASIDRAAATVTAVARQDAHSTVETTISPADMRPNNEMSADSKLASQ